MIKLPPIIIIEDIIYKCAGEIYITLDSRSNSKYKDLGNYRQMIDIEHVHR